MMLILLGHLVKLIFLCGRNTMTNQDNVSKSRDFILLTKVYIVRSTAFPVVMCGYESWTVKKAERQKIDAFKLSCWKRLQNLLDSKETKPVNPKGNQP